MNQSGASESSAIRNARSARFSRWSSNSSREPALASRAAPRAARRSLRMRARTAPGRREPRCAPSRDRATSTTGGTGGGATAAGASRVAREPCVAPVLSRGSRRAPPQALAPQRLAPLRGRRELAGRSGQPARAVRGSLLIPLALRPAASTSPSLSGRGVVSGAPLTASRSRCRAPA